MSEAEENEYSGIVLAGEDSDEEELEESDSEPVPTVAAETGDSVKYEATGTVAAAAEAPVVDNKENDAGKVEVATAVLQSPLTKLMQANILASSKTVKMVQSNLDKPLDGLTKEIQKVNRSVLPLRENVERIADLLRHATANLHAISGNIQQL
mmetsp:Transcript_24987/g.62919  ORF Transcript_24987/g.62919 Transcript_24987/m.62919 type:complete len:153 (-) Transcript_24987:687-1145(-)